MNKGFNDSAFMEYLKNTFNGFDNCFLRYTIENILRYGHKHHHVSKDQFIYFLLELIPELTFGEIAQFAEDEILTTYGKSEKRKFKEGEI